MEEARFSIPDPSKPLRTAAEASASRAPSVQTVRRRRRRLGAGGFFAGGASTFVILAVVGFGGGLFLADHLFNAPERAVAVAPVPPEVIYPRPMGPEAHAFAALTPRIAPPLDTPLTAANNAAPGAGTELKIENFAPQADEGGDTKIGVSLVASQPLHLVASANFAALERLDLLQTQAIRGGGSELNSGYDAVELPSVPEPASIALIALYGLIVTGFHSVMRRRRFAVRLPLARASQSRCGFCAAALASPRGGTLLS